METPRDTLRRLYPKEMERRDKGLCPFCGRPITEDSFRDKESRDEYRISGLCQHCQDSVFTE